MIDFNEYCKSIHGRRLTSYLLVIGPFEVNINVEPLDEVGSEIRLQCYGANVCKVIQKVMKIVASRSVQSKAQIASARSSSRYHSQALLHGLNAAALFLHAIAQQPPFFHLFFLHGHLLAFSLTRHQFAVFPFRKVTSPSAVNRRHARPGTRAAPVKSHCRNLPS